MSIARVYGRVSGVSIVSVESQTTKKFDLARKFAWYPASQAKKKMCRGTGSKETQSKGSKKTGGRESK